MAMHCNHPVGKASTAQQVQVVVVVVVGGGGGAVADAAAVAVLDGVTVRGRSRMRTSQP